MKTFIMAYDMEGWIIICKGLNVPTNEERWNEEHVELIQANSKVMNILYCAMNEEDFKNISTCFMAKEIWEKLEKIYGKGRKEEEIEKTQCSTSESQSLNKINSCLMAIEELEVTSKFCDSTPYTFDELQDAFEELTIEFENMNLKYKKMIFKFIVENEFLVKTKIDLEKKNEILKIGFQDCQKKNTILEKENLSLKMKFEELINEKQNVLNNLSHPKMMK